MRPDRCDRCLYTGDFYITVTLQHGEEEPTTQLWCWSCVSGQDEDE